MDDDMVPIGLCVLEPAAASYDVWGLGLIYYRLFVGSPLFRLPLPGLYSYACESRRLSATRLKGQQV